MIKKGLSFGAAILKKENASEKFPPYIRWESVQDDYATIYLCPKIVEDGNYAGYTYSPGYHSIPENLERYFAECKVSSGKRVILGAPGEAPPPSHLYFTREGGVKVADGVFCEHRLAEKEMRVYD